MKSLLSSQAEAMLRLLSREPAQVPLDLAWHPAMVELQHLGLIIITGGIAGHAQVVLTRRAFPFRPDLNN